MTRQRQNAPQIARQLTELAFAAPQVVAHRTLRMARAGGSPSARDQAEFMRMGTEKVAAFYQSWGAMWMAMWSMQMDFLRTWSTAGLSVSGAGLAPVHRRAVANAKRLGRRR